MLLHPLLLFWLHVGHYVWKTLEVLSDAAFSRVSSDADLQWGQSCLFTQGLRDLRLGGPCKLSLSRLHPPSPSDPREELSSVSSVWKPGVAPRAPPSRQVLKPTVSPEHHEVTDSQPSAGLGRVLGTFSDIRTDSSGLRSTFCLHSPRNPPELC